MGNDKCPRCNGSFIGLEQRTTWAGTDYHPECAERLRKWQEGLGANKPAPMPQQPKEDTQTT